MAGWEQAIVVFIIGSSFALFYTALTLNEIHNLLKWLLFSLGIFMLAIGTMFINYIIKLNIPSSYESFTIPLTIITVWLVVLFVFYFVGYYSLGVLKALQNVGKNKNDKK